MTTAVRVQALTHGYGRATVLSKLDFEIEAGEFFTIIGPNGAGKTTLLKLLSGLEHPRSGAILIGGRPRGAYRPRALARRLALVPQLAEADFPFTVREIVLMGRSPHMGLLGLDTARDRKVADQAMGFTDVAGLADRRLGQLSGGERQRVLLARAICQEPEIVLLDEPTAALDLAHQVRILDLMGRLQQERGMTVVMVSHDINLAALYADRMLLLKKGEKIALGAPDEIVRFATIEAAYGCKVVVDRNPLGGVPRVTPVPGKYLRTVE